jgi:glycine/D-amino acid oxidase-like deaminating enzyme
MGAIPAQLAAQLPEGSIHLNTQVTNISATLVRTSEGDIKCKAVVLATSAAAANELVPSFLTPQSNSVTTWYHLADCEAQELTGGRSTLVVDGLRYKYGNPDPMRPLVNTVVLSNSVPSYASDGRVLVSSSSVGIHDTADDEKLVRTHLTGLYDIDASHWSHVATYAIKDALPKMTPPHSPSDSVVLAPGVYLAGDYCDVSSINGAFKSARRAAQQLLLDGH